ncbi:MAG: glycoside hydrolase family 3 protein [Chloroflexota bacterium]|nr:MAG: glycoside hydrolase family 3 protein [Chloroflexota bacterium]
MRNSHLLVSIKVKLFRSLVLMATLLSSFWGSRGSASEFFQISSPQDHAEALLETLTPEERVGQLFLVSFSGTDVGLESQIYDLIKNHHIGGVFLQRESDNFLAPPQTETGTYQLTKALQTVEWSASQSDQIEPESNQDFRPAFIPLFIGISQEGNGPPADNLFNGLTALPSSMAIGATFQPELARQVGNVVGQELSALGINLLLGPSLDVLESPIEQGAGDLGVRTFGGDPFWVGEMGRAYVSGVHEGSAGRMGVVAKHFPGHGSSDRLPEEEVATVRKSLEQLKQIELPPFYAVTGNAPSELATVDGLLTSHIRYQGFQGNIRETTRPVSMDPIALDQLINLAPISNWVENGGVMVSENLGSDAFLRFEDPTGFSFQGRFVARDAFLAGNDLLVLGDQFISTSDPDQYSSVLRTLDLFAQKYRDDPAFQEQIDESVLKILTMKYRLNNNAVFTLGSTFLPQENLATVGESNNISRQVAQEALTLISPSFPDLVETIPAPPNINDRIVFITDVRTSSQCSTCADQQIFAKSGLRDAVLRLYGPLAGGQVVQRNLISYTFSELLALLNRAPEFDYTVLQGDLEQAQWIIFSMADVSTAKSSSQALSRFLAERPDLFQQKNLIVFAFDAPYYLDATEISKLNAYYGLYSKIPQFVDTAARVLFGEIPSPRGDLPVSVSGVNYDLISATSPDPDQTIELAIDIPEANLSTPVPTQIPQLTTGDLIPVRTGVIIDHNGHPVPDGTIVEFVLSAGVNELAVQRESTQDGIARTTFLIEEAGTIIIHARSDPAIESNFLQFDIPPEGLPTIEFVITQFPTETATEEAEPTETPQPSIFPETPSSPGQSGMLNWLIATVVSLSIGTLIYFVTTSFSVLRWGIRAGLLSTIGGLLAYMYLATHLPGSEQLLSYFGIWGVMMVTILGAGIGWGTSYGWQKISNSN